MQFDSATNLVAGARYEYSHNYTDKLPDINYRVDRKLERLFRSIFFSRKLSDNFLAGPIYRTGEERSRL